MEPLIAVVNVIATYVVPKALEKIGEHVAVESMETSKSAIQLMRETVSKKLKSTHTEGVLTIATTDPSESNIEILKAVLLKQMQDDEAFCQKLQKQLQRINQQSPNLQTVLENVRIRGDATVGNISQISTKAENIQQTIGKNVGVAGDLEIGDIGQEIL